MISYVIIGTADGLFEIYFKEPNDNVYRKYGISSSTELTAVTVVDMLEQREADRLREMDSWN